MRKRQTAEMTVRQFFFGVSKEVKVNKDWTLQQLYQPIPLQL